MWSNSTITNHGWTACSSSAPSLRSAKCCRKRKQTKRKRRCGACTRVRSAGKIEVVISDDAERGIRIGKWIPDSPLARRPRNDEILESPIRRHVVVAVELRLIQPVAEIKLRV